MINTVYFDMDGVLANFNLAFYDKFGLKPEEISNNQLWSRLTPEIDNGFFEKLEPFKPGIVMLEDYIEQGFHCEILSSCGTTSYNKILPQKNAWLDKHGITIPRNFVHNAKEKGEFATPDDLLVDDREKCIDEFTNAGGKGLWFTGYDYYGGK